MQNNSTSLYSIFYWVVIQYDGYILFVYKIYDDQILNCIIYFFVMYEM